MFVSKFVRHVSKVNQPRFHKSTEIVNTNWMKKKTTTRGRTFFGAYVL